MIDIKIEKIETKYYVLINLFNSNYICKEFKNMEDALNFQEEFYLNFCLFLMYGTDDKKVLEEYSQKKYLEYESTIYNYETFKESNIKNLFSRDIVVDSNSFVNYSNKQYKLIKDINDIKLLRNKITYRYLRLDKIRKVLKKILLIKSKKQGGFNLTNLYWDHTIPFKLCGYLFPNLITKYSEKEEKAIRKYTGTYFSIYNGLLHGNIVDIERLSDDFIDSFFDMLKCFKKTPYDLYLYRGSINDKKYCQKGNEYEYKQFISTSISSPSTIPFVKNEQYQLIIPKGTMVIFKGFSVDKNSSLENEVILLPSIFTIKEETGDKKILEWKEQIDSCNLLLDNLLKNRDYYIEHIGYQQYEHIYSYILKQIFEFKKDQIQEMKENKIERLPNIVSELSLLFNYYGVYNQKDNYDVRNYRF